MEEIPFPLDNKYFKNVVNGSKTIFNIFNICSIGS